MHGSLQKFVFEKTNKQTNKNTKQKQYEFLDESQFCQVD